MKNTSTTDAVKAWDVIEVRNADGVWREYAAIREGEELAAVNLVRSRAPSMRIRSADTREVIVS